MKIVDCIEKLKSEIKYAYNETKKTLGDNMIYCNVIKKKIMH